MKKIAEMKGQVRIPKDSLSKDDLFDLKKALTYESPSFIEGEVDLFIDYKENKTHIFVPVIFFQRNKNLFFKDYEIIDKRYDKIIETDIKNNIILRDYQKQIVGSLFKEMKNENRIGIIKSNVGTGKSIMMLYTAFRSKRKTIILVHRDSLMKQFVKLINEAKVLENVKLGIIKGNKREVEGKDIVIAMIETVMLPKNAYLLQDFGLLMVDEVERSAGQVFINAIKNCPAKNKIGWSATPYRKDGGKNVLKNNMNQVIVDADAMGIGQTLISPNVIMIGHDFHIYPYGKEPTRVTSYFENTINKNVDRNNMVLTLIMHLANNKDRNILVMTNRTAMIDNIVNFLRREGYPSVVGLKGGVKEAVLEQAKTTQIIVSNKQFISVGVSLNHLNTLVMAGFIPGGLQQKVGRILREDDGKERLVFDFIDMKSDLSKSVSEMKIRQYKDKVNAINVYGYRWGDIFNTVNSTNYKKGDFIDSEYII